MNRKLTTGFYQPTESFKSIPEHIAVMFEDNQGLVAVCGAVDDDIENVKETIATAKLFAAAPDMLEALKRISADVEEWNSNKMGGTELQRRRWQSCGRFADAAIAKATAAAKGPK